MTSYITDIYGRVYTHIPVELYFSKQLVGLSLKY